MIDILADGSSWSRAASFFAVDVAAKAAFLCLAAWILARALGRRQALARSALLHAALAGLLLLPLAHAAFPRLRIACLPALENRFPGGEWLAMTAMEPARRGEAEPTVTEAPAAESAFAADEPAPLQEGDVASIESSAATQKPAQEPSWRAAIDATTIALMLYATVAGLLLFRLARSLRAVAALRRSSVAIDEQAWLAALARWRARLGLTRQVRFAHSGQVAVPIVIGWLRPTIIVPTGLETTAKASAIDAVLLHELAHVRRGDFAWNVVLRWVQILYWPHPLVWLMGREVALVREQACDALCVGLLNDAAQYRASLVELAAGLVRPPREALGMAMAASSKLARRLAQIDQSAGCPRCLLGWPARAAVVAAALVVCGLLGTLRFGSAVAAGPDDAADESSGRRVGFWKDDTSGNQYFVGVQQVEPDGSNEPEESADSDEPVPVQVTVAKAQRTDFRVQTRQPGMVVAAREAEIYSRVTGFVAESNVHIGDRVKKGELLAVIEAPELDAEIERAEEAADEAAAGQEEAEAAVEAAKAAIESDQARVAEAESAVDSAQSTVTYRKKQQARLAELDKNNAVSAEVLDEHEEKLQAAEGTLAAAKAKLAAIKAGRVEGEAGLREAMARLRLAAARQKGANRRLERSRRSGEQRRIVAPFDGVVSNARLDVGMLVRGPAENKPLLIVTTTDRVVFVVQVPYRDAALLNTGDPATIEIDSLPGVALKGSVSRTGHGLDPHTRTMRAEIDLDNPDGRLLAGMYGSVSIVLETRPDTLTVPSSAVWSPQNGKYFCLRVVEGRAVRTAIKVGRQGDQTEVLGGLAAGEKVVTAMLAATAVLPPYKLVDGQVVEIVDRFPIEESE